MEKEKYGCFTHNLGTSVVSIAAECLPGPWQSPGCAALVLARVAFLVLTYRIRSSPVK